MDGQFGLLARCVRLAIHIDFLWIVEMRVTVDGYAWILKQELEPIQLKWLKSQLTVPIKGTPCSTVECFIEEPDRIGIARSFFRDSATRHHTVEDKTCHGNEFNPITRSEPYLPSEDNKAAIAVVLEKLGLSLDLVDAPSEPHANGGVICSPNGLGEIDAVLSIVSMSRLTTLVLTNSAYRSEKWKKHITARWPEAEIGSLANREWYLDNAPVVLAQIGSVASMVRKGVMPPLLERAFGMVVVDQSDLVDPEDLSVAIGFFHASKRLGLCASQARKDGADKVVEYHIGKKIYCVETKTLTPRIRRVFTQARISHPYFNPQLASKDIVFNVIAKNTSYNEAVVEQVIKALDANRKIVVFSDKFDHLKRLKSEVDSLYRSRTITTDYIIDGMVDTDMDRALSSDVVFSTYSMAKRQTTVVMIDTVVLASPVEDPTHCISWSLLRCDGKKDPVIVDMRIDQIPLCKEYGDSRDRVYNRLFSSQDGQ